MAHSADEQTDHDPRSQGAAWPWLRRSYVRLKLSSALGPLSSACNVGVAPLHALASPAMAYRILEFPLDFSCLFFPIENGKQFSQGDPFWAKVEFLLRKR